MISLLDESFRDKSLNDCENILENKILNVNKMKEREVSISKDIVKERKKVLQMIEESVEGAEGLQTRIKSELENVAVTTLQKGNPLLSIFTNLPNEIEQLYNIKKYLTLLQNVETISEEAKNKCLQTEIDSEDLLSCLTKLSLILPETTSYPSLYSLLIKRIEIISAHVQKHVVSTFIQSLEDIGFPIVNENSSILEEKELIEHCHCSFQHLLNLAIYSNTENDGAVATNKTHIDEIIRPIQKRFNFHFIRKTSETNRIDKPEWFLTFILKVLRWNLPFISSLKWDNPVEDVSIVIERLVGLACDKIKRNIESIPADKSTSQVLLSHMLDEILLFEESISVEFKYVHSLSSPLQRTRAIHSFTNSNENLHLWINTDLACAMQRLKLSLNLSKTPWYHSLGSNNKQTLSSLALTQLLNNLANRFNMCNSLSQYLSAIDSIVSHLLLYYLEAITVEWKEKNIANQEKDWSTCGGLLDSLMHILNFIQNWPDNNINILELTDYFTSTKVKKKGLLVTLQNKLKKNANDFLFSLYMPYEISGIWVDEASSFLNTLIQFTHQIVNEIKINFDQLNSGYLTKHFNMNDLRICEDVSCEFADALTYLNRVMPKLKRSMSEFLFRFFLQAVSFSIDDLVYRKYIINENRSYSDFGASQIVFDLQSLINSFPSLPPASSSSPSFTVCPHLKDCCLLFTLPPQKRKFLLDALLALGVDKHSSTSDAVENSHAKEMLETHAIFVLSPFEAVKICQETL